MYDWSKKVVSKIKESNCLSKGDLRIVEVALRMYDVCDNIVDEALGIEKTDRYELTQKCK